MHEDSSYHILIPCLQVYHILYNNCTKATAIVTLGRQAHSTITHLGRIPESTFRV